MAPSPATELVPTRHGPMWIFSGDPGCSGMLKIYGEYSEGELALMRLYAPPDGLLIDAGAHIGAHTIPLARHARKVIAIEPQKAARELLERNVEMSGLKNIEILDCALGAQAGTTFYSMAHTTWAGSYGSVGMEGHEFEGAESARMVTLDSLGLEPSFIKIDVEGMEPHVIAGGEETLKAWRPGIFAEFQDSTENLQINLTGMFRYYTAKITLPFHVVNNFNKVTKDHYPKTGHCMHLYLPMT